MRFLKTFFLSFFQDSMAYTQHRQILFYLLLAWFLLVHLRTSLYIQWQQIFLFIINLRILSFSQVRFSLRPIQFLKHLGLPQPLPTPPTNSTTSLLSNFTGKESASLEYLIDITFNPYHEQVIFTPSQMTFSLRPRLVF